MSVSGLALVVFGPVELPERGIQTGVDGTQQAITGIRGRPNGSIASGLDRGNQGGQLLVEGFPRVPGGGDDGTPILLAPVPGDRMRVLFGGVHHAVVIALGRLAGGLRLGLSAAFGEVAVPEAVLGAMLEALVGRGKLFADGGAFVADDNAPAFHLSAAVRVDLIDVLQVRGLELVDLRRSGGVGGGERGDRGGGLSFDRAHEGDGLRCDGPARASGHDVCLAARLGDGCGDVVLLDFNRGRDLRLGGFRLGSEGVRNLLRCEGDGLIDAVGSAGKEALSERSRSLAALRVFAALTGPEGEPDAAAQGLVAGGCGLDPGPRSRVAGNRSSTLAFGERDGAIQRRSHGLQRRLAFAGGGRGGCATASRAAGSSGAGVCRNSARRGWSGRRRPTPGRRHDGCGSGTGRSRTGRWCSRGAERARQAGLGFLRRAIIRLRRFRLIACAGLLLYGARGWVIGLLLGLLSRLVGGSVITLRDSAAGAGAPAGRGGLRAARAWR